MPVVGTTVHVETHGGGHVIDVTNEVTREIVKSGLSEGIGCLFVPGATGGLTTIEFEPGCVVDLQRLFDRLVPPGDHYEHQKRWGDDNGHSHVRAALLGPSLAFPFRDGAPLLGTWQQIIFVDFDTRPRSRKLALQLVGE